MYKFFTLLSILITSTAIAGEQRFVTDQLEITLRSGESTQYQILRMLPSGTPVEVLQVNPESGYSQIRTADGAEGWVISRYLDPRPSARQRLAAADKEVTRLKRLSTDLKAKYTRLLQEKNQLASRLKKFSGDKQQLDHELQRIKKTSANALALDQENKTLKTKLQQLETEFQLTRQENKTLNDRSDRDWFMTGAGVILLGMLIGLIIPKIRWRRKSNWSSL